MSQTDSRNHKIKCTHGVTDYFNYYKDNVDKPVGTLLYRKILKDYLNANREAISIKAYSFNLPQRLGRIEIRKIKKEIKIDKNGKIINKLVPNWKATNKLWAENPQAKEKKIKIRYTNEHTDGYVFRIVYLKYTANYKNKSIYKMHLNREMRRATNPSIVENKIDAFLLKSN